MKKITLKLGLLFLASILFVMCGSLSNQRSATSAIPYEDALDASAVVQDNLDDYEKNGIFLGNGDIYGVTYAIDQQIEIRLFKSDVWDSRMGTESDPPLPTVDVKGKSWTGKRGSPASWKKHRYPNQFSYGNIRIKTGADVSSAKLDLRRSVATITTPTESMNLRALMETNVYLLEAKSDVSLMPFESRDRPLAKVMTKGDVEYMVQKFPGDEDYDGFDVMVVLLKDGDNKVVATVTSLDSDDMFGDACALAQSVLDSKQKAIAKSDSVWRDFWSKSGVKIADKDFQNWWYRQLHFFRSFTRVGSTPAGLCAGALVARWHGSYKINYNIWQTYWTPLNYNHPRLVRPWIEHLYQQLPRARWFAKEAYGCEGAAYSSDTWPHEVDPAKCTTHNKHQVTYMPWAYTMGMSGMGIQNVWNCYIYDPDVDYLRNRIYPVISEVAQFFASYISQCDRNEDGMILLGPSYNPEHGDFGSYNNPYDLTYTKFALEAAIKAATILGVDADKVEVWRDYSSKLIKYETIADPKSQAKLRVSDGLNSELTEIGYNEYRKYNIPTPIVPLFPGDQVTWFESDDVHNVFKNSIDHIEPLSTRKNSVVMMNVARARLSMTDEWMADFKPWFKRKEESNGLFQWEGHGHFLTEQCAVGSMLNEAMMQSVGDVIRIFPSWAKDIDAEFTNLRARGGFLVSASQRDGKFDSFTIESTVGGAVNIYIPDGWDGIDVPSADYEVNGRILTINTKSNTKYTVKR